MAIETTPSHATIAARRFLGERIDYERASAIPYNERDFRLDRMRELLARLDNPHQKLRVIHVAGTKGKGSTAAMIESILRAAGLRTGLYSSPHLHRVEERLAIDGQPCTADEFTQLVERIQPVVAEMDRVNLSDPRQSNRPTYFEIVTALAMLRFALERVDAAVLEVGLGGRLDSTNVCDPIVSVITSISFDHMELLGNTLPAIAGEKAGIIKPGRPVISGVIDEEPRAVIERVAAEQGAPLVQLSRDFDFEYSPPAGLETGPQFGRMSFIDRSTRPNRRIDNIELGLLGHHQGANAAVALAAICELQKQGWSVPDDAIRSGLKDVRWPARVEIVSRHPAVIIDSAHNRASAAALAEVIKESIRAPRRILIFATSREKDVRGMLEVLLPEFDELILTRYQNNPRGMPVEELAALGREIACIPLGTYPDPATAWQAAQATATPDDLIVITGSFFIAGEMREILGCSAGERGT